MIIKKNPFYLKCKLIVIPQTSCTNSENVGKPNLHIQKKYLLLPTLFVGKYIFYTSIFFYQ
ncbi:MAG: hypothetical protein EAZ08_08345 [Cytophagales bacterium]|nr:MAG: hypothetical protein EAZ08_08345 [Cytophagales bacterium]